MQEDNERLQAVFERAREVRLMLNPKKSTICKSEVRYVGHLLTAQGIKPNPECEALKSGLGAALLQDQRPISMASKALTNCQGNFAVIKKEILAICFWCSKLYFGQEVTVVTDDKLLVNIMNKPIHQLTVAY